MSILKGEFYDENLSIGYCGFYSFNVAWYVCFQYLDQF